MEKNKNKLQKNLAAEKIKEQNLKYKKKNSDVQKYANMHECEMQSKYKFN